MELSSPASSFHSLARQGCQSASRKAHLGLPPMESRNSEYSNRSVGRNDDTVASSCLRLRRVFTKDAHQGCQRASRRARSWLMRMETRNSEYSDRFVRRNDVYEASSGLRLRRVFTEDAHQGCQRASQKAHLWQHHQATAAKGWYSR